MKPGRGDAGRAARIEEIHNQIRKSNFQESDHLEHQERYVRVTQIRLCILKEIVAGMGGGWN